MDLIKLICELGPHGVSYSKIACKGEEKRAVIVCHFQDNFGGYKKQINKTNLNRLSVYHDSMDQSVRVYALIYAKDEEDYKPRLLKEGVQQIELNLKRKEIQIEKIKSILAKCKQ